MQDEVVPLKWPANWDRLSISIQICAHLPVLGVSTKLRAVSRSLLGIRTEQVWNSWTDAKAPLSSIRECCSVIETGGGWPSNYFHPDDSFSLVCHDWAGLQRQQIDIDILNAVCGVLRPDLLVRGNGFIDVMIKSLVKQGDIACVLLPADAVDWSLVRFFEYIMDVKVQRNH